MASLPPYIQQGQADVPEGWQQPRLQQPQQEDAQVHASGSLLHWTAEAFGGAGSEDAIQDADDGVLAPQPASAAVHAPLKSGMPSFRSA